MNKYIFFLISFVFLCGCCNQSNNYDIKFSPDSKTMVRINNNTGEILCTRGSNYYEIKGDSIRVLNLKKDENFSQLKNYETYFPESNNKIKIKIAYKYIDDCLKYKLKIEPFTKELRNLGEESFIFLEFYDNDFFKVLEKNVNINIYELRPIVDNSGKTVFVEIEGKVICSKEDYSTISHIGNPWIFTEKFKNELSKFIKEIP